MLDHQLLPQSGYHVRQPQILQESIAPDAMLLQDIMQVIDRTHANAYADVSKHFHTDTKMRLFLGQPLI